MDGIPLRNLFTYLNVLIPRPGAALAAIRLKLRDGDTHGNAGITLWTHRTIGHRPIAPESFLQELVILAAAHHLAGIAEHQEFFLIWQVGTFLQSRQIEGHV